METLVLWLRHTMIIERGLGVAVYLAVILIAYSSLLKAKSSKKVYRIFTVVIILLGIMAFFYIPGITADLTRWREIIYDWANYSPSAFFTMHLKRCSTPSSYTLMYLSQKTGLKGTLPAVVCVLYFLAVFNILYSEHKSGNISSFAAAQAFFFFMAAGTFLEVISGVRCFLALSIVAWCFYRESVRGKTIIANVLFYLIACTIHLAAIPLVVIRMVFLFICAPSKKTHHYSDYITAALFCGGGIIFGWKYVLAAIKKGNTYLTHDMYSNLWEYLIGVLCLIVIIITLLRFREIRTEQKYLRLKNLSGFCTLMAVVEVCFFFEYSIFHRFVMFNSILILPVICAVTDSQLEKRHSGYINSLRVLSILILAIACFRGNLCGYKFFVL